MRGKRACTLAVDVVKRAILMHAEVTARFNTMKRVGCAHGMQALREAAQHTPLMKSLVHVASGNAFVVHRVEQEAEFLVGTQHHPASLFDAKRSTDGDGDKDERQREFIVASSVRCARFDAQATIVGILARNSASNMTTTIDALSQTDLHALRTLCEERVTALRATADGAQSGSSYDALARIYNACIDRIVPTMDVPSSGGAHVTPVDDGDGRDG